MAQYASSSPSVSRVSSVSGSPNRSPQWQDWDEVSPRSSTGSAKSKRHRDGAWQSNQGSPLLAPVDAQYDRASGPNGIPTGSLPQNNGEEEASKSQLFLFILSLSIGGLQMAWAVEFSNGSPYLLSLGMSKSLLALVWVAGPLGGVLVQPYIGIRSDNCRISWGKRLPFMIAGALATAVSFLALSWTKEIVHGFLGMFGADVESYGVKVCSLIWAVAFVYILDFSINAVQAGIRAFIVDNAPTHQQEDANAWAGRITGIGNILGYVTGSADLPRIFPFLGRTSFQVLCSIASIALCSTVAISALYIRERDPRLEGPPTSKNPNLVSFFRRTFNSVLRLPVQVRKVCEAQFFGWLGWFGFLFYQTTYIGQLHVNPYFASHPDLTPAEIDQAWEEATRVGTYALLIFAITSFAASMILPILVAPSFIYPLPPIHSSSPPTFRTRITRLLNALQIQWLTLRRAWLLSHLLFALCMASTFFVSTPTGATILTSLIGIPWALSLWAPFALISAEISKRDSEARRNHRRSHEGTAVVAAQEDQAGVILGLHNVAISAPQIVATLVSSAIFKAAQKPRGTPGDESVGWVLRFGGLAALAAAYFTWRVGEERDLPPGSGERPDGIAMARGYERVRDEPGMDDEV